MASYEMSLTFLVSLLFVFATVANAEIVRWRPCLKDDSASSECTINELRVNPCREAANNKPCRIKKGRDATISFDFTPDFAATTLESKAFWTTQTANIPFVGMDTNGCVGTTCPVTAGTKQTYSYTLPIDRNFPARSYDVKWTLKNQEKKECCFIFQIKLH